MEGQTLVSEASKGVTTLITSAEYKLIGITLSCQFWLMLDPYLRNVNQNTLLY